MAVVFASVTLWAVGGGFFSSCSDEPDGENYYTFTGEMMNEWLTSRPEYSQFAEIVTRAGLMDQLSVYGHYTCFAPDNKAVDAWLKGKGRTLESLTDAECDTIARTHLVSVMYTTFDMKDGTLAQQNMNKRPIEVSHGVDEDGNSVVLLQNDKMIYYTLQDDSVENGVMQPINGVLESSNNLLPDLIKKNDSVKIYYKALVETGLAEEMMAYKDGSYKDTDEFYDYITGSNIHEAATPPDDHLFGFTAFLVKDTILGQKYGVHSVKGLYDLACQYYKEGEGTPGYSFENLTDPINPLRRFLQYHILNRNCQGWNFLTVRDDFGVYTALMDPTDWYETMLPYAMMKISHLTVQTQLDDVGPDQRLERYINRRYEGIASEYKITGVHIQKAVEKEYVNNGLNGFYFYVDDILTYDGESDVFNCRMRMDFSTIFPEVMTNAMRMNGDRTKDDDKSDTSYDHTYKYGRNFYFPNGYLDNVEVGGNGYFIYRRPRQGYWSLHGDEFICQGNYDISFRIPPVPYEGEWQVRLGYAAMDIRGIAQIYFDGTPVGIPLDMTRNLSHSSILGTAWTASYANAQGGLTMDNDKATEERKTLKNKGFLRGCRGGYRTDGTTPQPFANIPQTLRIVLYQGHIQPGTDHYIRVRAVSSKQGNNNEVMLDYLELVPKSVYGVTDGEGAQEDDL